MKSLIVTLEYPPIVGGISTYVYNLASHLAADEVVVCAPKNNGDKDFDSKQAWKTYRVEPYFFLFWPRWLKLYFAVSKIVKKEKIDHLYVQHVLPVGYVAYLLKFFKKIPYTLFLHGTDIELALSSRGKFKKFLKICRSADKVVVNSEFLKNKLLAAADGLKDVRVIYPCPSDFFFDDLTDRSEIERLRSQLALGGKKVIITVARMVEGKGYPHLIRILPEVLKKIPNLVWLVLGDGPKSKEIFSLVEKNNLQNVVRLVGTVEAKNLPKFYALADLFVLFTHRDEHHEEGWGTVFLEAAACGLPVLAGRVGGVEEAIKDHFTGELVDILQTKPTTEAVVSLLSNKDLLKQYGLAGKERVFKDFRWENEVKKLF